MAEQAPAAPPPKPAKRKSTSKAKNSGVKLSDLIVRLIAASKERSGVSLYAIKRNLAAGGYDVIKNKSRIIRTLNRLVDNGTLIRVKGLGASGSFKLNKKTGTKEKPAKKTAKRKPAATKKKTTTDKKTKKTAKSPAAKKPLKKTKKPTKSKTTTKSPAKKAPKKAAKKTDTTKRKPAKKTLGKKSTKTVQKTKKTVTKKK